MGTARFNAIIRAFGSSRLRGVIVTALLIAVLALLEREINAQVATPITSPGSLAALGLPELAIKATDAGFEGVPAAIAAGRYLVTFVNKTASTDSVGFIRLPDGKGVEALGPSAPPGTPVADGPVEDAGEWTYKTYISGGPGAPPGETVTAIIDLPPGSFAVWPDDPMWGPDPLPITVTGEIATARTVPAADVTVHQVDSGGGFAFHIEGEFRAGPQVIEIRNESSQPHTMKLFLADELLTDSGSLTDELLETMFWGSHAPVAYASVQSSGTTTWLEVDLLQGKYVLACFVPDVRYRDSFPHALEGMAEVITID